MHCVVALESLVEWRRACTHRAMMTMTASMLRITVADLAAVHDGYPTLELSPFMYVFIASVGVCCIACTQLLMVHDVRRILVPLPTVNGITVHHAAFCFCQEIACLYRLLSPAVSWLSKAVCSPIHCAYFACCLLACLQCRQWAAGKWR